MPETEMGENENAIREIIAKVVTIPALADVLLRGLRAEWKAEDEKAAECDHAFELNEYHCIKCGERYDNCF